MKQLTALILSLLFGLNVFSSEYPEFSMFGELPAWAFYVRHEEGPTMKNISERVKARDYRPAFVFDDVKNLKIDQLRITENAGYSKKCGEYRPENGSKTPEESQVT